MKILAFDTTAKAVCAAVCEDEKLLSSYFAELPGVHTTETLLPAIEIMLKNADLTIDDMELIAVSAGPGSFTGVRIGVATAKGLAFGKELPCAGVSSLLAMASNFLDRDAYVCAAMDARRNQLYYALFKIEGGKLTRLTDDTADGADAAARTAKEMGITEVLCVGDGAEIAAAAMENEEIKAKLPTATLLRQNAYGVALCGLECFRAGKAVPESELLPIYLRGFGN
ncbi:MAG: tRNA (adenosine(37)-N6)-threonylcarbamoyltransferase complex dimerization subunit type 1 TsaB [Ruminococcaceae bacterium]|nr:tRNA (adenosine(37)-N6)-threonylcarbamoyltransferase complex dimerization subunit type 1 TsaB [Oscillospiraceae bacterium]